MSVVPQLDFCFYPSQVFWFLFAFSLLYFVVQHTVVPRLEAALGQKLAYQSHALDEARDGWGLLHGELMLQKLALEHASLRAVSLEKRAQEEMESMIAETKRALADELDEITRDIDVMLRDYHEKERGDLVTLSTEIALLYCAKMNFGENKAWRERMRQLVAEVYGEKLC